MAAKKKVHRGKAARKSQPSHLERAWDDTRRVLRSAEASVGRRVAALVEESRVPTRKAVKRAAAWSDRLGREGRRAAERLEARLVTLQQSVRRERRTLARWMDDAMARTLAGLNIPTRHELQHLSRRVEQLSRRVEGLR